MPVDYDQIREENTRGYGEYEHHFFFLEQLYDRRTHFVFELLQNADDARAKKVEFVIHEDRLDVVHDGRLFDENDVRAICGIAESNKADEDEKIGRFGIGFKSVYSYTSSPGVHSGDEHFKIEKYVRPIATTPRAIRIGMTTLFSLPFDKDSIPADVAAAELRSFFADRSQFPSTVLLFLRNVEEVAWRTPGGDQGEIVSAAEHDGGDGRRVLLNRVDSGGSEHEVWLSFSKDLSAIGFPKLSVQTAFRIGDRDGAPAIERLERAPLAVFFPTAVETNLGFLVQGPYRTTPARDNLVRDNEINDGIHEQVADLVVQSAIGLQQRGWLDTAALECFPLRAQDFPADSPFNVLYSTFRDAVRREPLIPTHGGGFGRGGELRVSPSELLPDLFDGDRLEALLGTTEHSGTRWVNTEVTPRRRPDLYRYLTQSSNDDAALAPELRTIQIVRQLDAAFMEAQSLDWTLRLYEFLDEQNEMQVRQTLAMRQWIRCEDGKCRAAAADGEPLVWLPPTGSGDVGYPTVARALARDATVRNLLSRYGVTPRDEVDEILDDIISLYRDADLRPLISANENLEHVRRFLDAVSNGGTRTNLLVQRIRETPVLLATSAATGESEFRMPDEVYARSEDLEAWFDGSPQGWFVHEQYASIQDRLQILGVHDGLVIKRRTPDARGFVVVRRDHGAHVRGIEGFDPHCAVDGMNYAFENPSVDRARFAWNVLLPQLARSIRGGVESGSRKDFQNARREDQYSPFGRLVTELSWLPRRDGGFFRPDELKAEDLPDDFVWHEQAAHAVGMRGSTVAQVADALGVDPAYIQFMKTEAARFAYEEWQKQQDNAKARDERDQATGSGAAATNLDFGAELAKALTREGKGEAYKPEAHLDPLPNPGRRSGVIDGEIAEARQHEPAAVERFRRVPQRVWEAKNNETRTFIEQEYVGECQICHQWFRKRNGGLYFEAHYLVSNKQAAWIDRPGNVLCLCAQCGAKFAHGEVDAGGLVAQVAEWRPSTSEGFVDIAIRLCGEDKVLRFSARHLLDLQALLRAGSAPVESAAEPIVHAT